MTASSSTPAVSIVLPTYNESESLPGIIPRIHETLSAQGIDGEVVVVDDGSPDGTADVADRLAQQYPVRVIRRTHERGLATAVLTGFDCSRAPICVVMDADGSHPVSALPAMVRMIQQDKADIVVGSRNIAGGGSRNWPLFSQLKSKLAASLTFGLTSMTDPTTGLMALRKSLLPGLQLDPVGWKIVLEIVVKAAPARVAEVPILFEDRELGQSKQSLHIFLQYVEHLLKLYAHRYKGLAELATFCLIGLAGLFLDLGTVIATKELTALDTRLCAVFGFAVAVTANFILNRRFTFAHGRDLPWLYSYLTYAGTNLLGLSVRMGVVHALMVFAALDQGHGYVLSNALGIVLATGFNFVGAKYFAFDPERLSARAQPADASRLNEPRTSGALRIGAALLIAIALGYSAFDSSVARHLKTDDEGVNVTMANNMLASRELVLRPSVYPGGRRDWVSEDLPALGNTPFYPGLLALAGAKLGLPGMGIVPWLSLWVAIAFSALLFWQQSSRSTLYTALLLASSPGFLSEASSLEFEPTLTAFCAAGLYFVVRGTRARRLLSCFIGGALLGLGFLTKLWLIAPFALAGCGFALVQTTLARERDEHPLYLRRSLGAALLGFLVTASAHISLLAVLAPHDLPSWIESVYLGIFSGHGVTGGKLSAAAQYAARPVWYYPAVLYERHFYLLPLALLGLPALLRRARVHAIGALAMAFGAWLSVIVLSVPAVKEPLYVLAVAPLWYVLAGTCLAELENDSKMFEPANRIVVQTVLSLALLAGFAGVAWSWTFDGAAQLRAALVHAAGMIACAAVGLQWLWRRRIGGALLAGCALSLACFIASAERSRAADPQPVIAVALRSALQDAPAAYPSFVAPQSKLLMGYLGRAGLDWSALQEPARAAVQPGLDVGRSLADPALRAFVLGPEQFERPGVDALLPRLQSVCEERPLSAAGADYRVLVRLSDRRGGS